MESEGELEENNVDQDNNHYEMEELVDVAGDIIDMTENSLQAEDDPIMEEQSEQYNEEDELLESVLEDNAVQFKQEEIHNGTIDPDSFDQTENIDTTHIIDTPPQESNQEDTADVSKEKSNELPAEADTEQIQESHCSEQENLNGPEKETKEEPEASDQPIKTDNDQQLKDETQTEGQIQTQEPPQVDTEHANMASNVFGNQGSQDEAREIEQLSEAKNDTCEETTHVNALQIDDQSTQPLMAMKLKKNEDDPLAAADVPVATKEHLHNMKTALIDSGSGQASRSQIIQHDHSTEEDAINNDVIVDKDKINLKQENPQPETVQPNITSNSVEDNKNNIDLYTDDKERSNTDTINEIGNEGKRASRDLCEVVQGIEKQESFIQGAQETTEAKKVETAENFNDHMNEEEIELNNQSDEKHDENKSEAITKYAGNEESIDESKPDTESEKPVDKPKPDTESEKPVDKPKPDTESKKPTDEPKPGAPSSILEPTPTHRLQNLIQGDKFKQQIGFGNGNSGQQGGFGFGNQSSSQQSFPFGKSGSGKNLFSNFVSSTFTFGSMSQSNTQFGASGASSLFGFQLTPQLNSTVPKESGPFQLEKNSINIYEGQAKNSSDNSEKKPTFAESIASVNKAFGSKAQNSAENLVPIVPTFTLKESNSSIVKQKTGDSTIPPQNSQLDTAMGTLKPGQGDEIKENSVGQPSQKEIKYSVTSAPTELVVPTTTENKDVNTQEETPITENEEEIVQEFRARVTYMRGKDRTLYGWNVIHLKSNSKYVKASYSKDTMLEGSQPGEFIFPDDEECNARRIKEKSVAISGGPSENRWTQIFQLEDFDKSEAFLNHLTNCFERIAKAKKDKDENQELDPESALTTKGETDTDAISRKEIPLGVAKNVIKKKKKSKEEKKRMMMELKAQLEKGKQNKTEKVNNESNGWTENIEAGEAGDFFEYQAMDTIPDGEIEANITVPEASLGAPVETEPAAAQEEKGESISNAPTQPNENLAAAQIEPVLDESHAHAPALLPENPSDLNANQSVEVMMKDVKGVAGGEVVPQKEIQTQDLVEETRESSRDKSTQTDRQIETAVVPVVSVAPEASRPPTPAGIPESEVALQKSQLVDDMCDSIKNKIEEKFSSLISNLKSYINDNDHSKKDYGNFSQNPWDRDAYQSRLSTFKPSTWGFKRSKIDAVECARHGWINSGPNRLESDQGAEIHFDPLAQEDLETDRVRVQISGQGHSFLSLWVGNACPSTFREYPDFLSKEKVAINLIKEAKTLKAVIVNVQFSESCKGIFEKYFHKLMTACNNDGDLFKALQVAILGWRPEKMSIFGEEEDVVLTCINCNSCLPIGFVMQQEKLDFVQEHRFYCYMSNMTAIEHYLKVIEAVSEDTPLTQLLKSASSGDDHEEERGVKRLREDDVDINV